MSQNDLNPDFQQKTELQQLKEQVERLQNTFDYHTHSGTDSQKIDFAYLMNIFETVTVAPALPTIPKNIYEQIKIQLSGGVYKLYIFDASSNAWKSVTLT